MYLGKVHVAHEGCIKGSCEFPNVLETLTIIYVDTATCIVKTKVGYIKIDQKTHLTKVSSPFMTWYDQI